jgi:hypothetical protein
MKRLQRPARRPKAPQPFFEVLEDRTVLSGGLLAAPLDLLPPVPVQAPAIPATSAPAASSSLLGILDAPVARDAKRVTTGLDLKVQVDAAVPGLVQLRLATDLSLAGNQGLAARTTLDAGVTVLGASVLNSHTGAALGLGGANGITLNLGTTTTLAGGSLLTLNGNVGATLGGGKGVGVATGAGLEVGGQGSLSAGTGGTVVLNNGGGSAGGGGGVILGNPGGGGSGGAGGGGIIPPGNGGGSGQGPGPGSGGIVQPGGGAFGQGPPAVAGPGGSFSASPAAPVSAAGSGTTAPGSALAGPTTGSLALLSGAANDTAGADFLPVAPAGIEEATTGQALLEGAAVDTLFQNSILFGAGNDTDLSNVVLPEAPAAVAEPGVAAAEPVVSDPILFDGAQPLLPQGDDLVQGCMPFDVKSLDDSLHNLVQQFQLLSWDFASLMGRLEGSSWFVAMAVLAVTCEVCRRKTQKARQRLSLADGSLTWFPTLTGSGSSEER